MIRIPWDLEEAVVLLDVYIRNGRSMAVPDDELDQLTEMYLQRAKMLGYIVDEKFRNRTGLKMQIAGLHYIATNGEEGLSNVSKIFYEAFELYQDKPRQFERLKNEFKRKYSGNR